jgi:tRNA C32,U32 (ribose-2'-O)-methylase TrmJ
MVTFLPRFFVILVEPKNDGNIGAVCRVMKNFGFSDLIIINHPEIGVDANKRAMHANDVLQNARHVQNLDKAIEGLDFIVGTSGKINISIKNNYGVYLT